MSELKAEQWLDYAGEPRPCYPKSEADKVIAHHKYKRCLAMAKYCEAMCGHYLSYEEPKWFWYRKWHMHWLALAEEPTWAKFLQLIHKETAKDGM